MKLLLNTLICSVVIVFSAQISRNDIVTTSPLHLNGGKYGKWGSDIFCDDGHYAHGFALNVDIEGGDDEGAVSLKLYCENELLSSSNADSALSSDGRWDNVFCDTASEQKIRSFQIRSGSSSVGIVSIKGECTNKQQIEPANGRDFWSTIDDDARFGEWSVCPSGSAVCGYNQMIEDDAITDKSGLNQVKFYCCSLPSKQRQFQSQWKQVAVVGGEQSGSITHSITVGVTKSLTTWDEVADTKSITKSIETGASFESGASAKVTLSAEQSKTVTNKIVNSIQNSVTEAVSVNCNAGSKAMYQYVMDGVEEIVGGITGTINIHTQEIWCMSALNLEPKCPPTFCAESNSDCQHCTQEFAAFTAGIPVYESYLIGSGNNVDHLYAIGNEPGYSNGSPFNIYSVSTSGRLPLYRYYNGAKFNHFYTTNLELSGFTINQSPGEEHNGWQYEGILGYCESTQKAGTIPLYRYHYADGFDHYYTTVDKGATVGFYAKEGIQCYVPMF